MITNIFDIIEEVSIESGFEFDNKFLRWYRNLGTNKNEYGQIIDFLKIAELKSDIPNTSIEFHYSIDDIKKFKKLLSNIENFNKSIITTLNKLSHSNTFSSFDNGIYSNPRAEYNPGSKFYDHNYLAYFIDDISKVSRDSYNYGTVLNGKSVIGAYAYEKVLNILLFYLDSLSTGTKITLDDILKDNSFDIKQLEDTLNILHVKEQRVDSKDVIDIMQYILDNKNAINILEMNCDAFSNMKLLTKVYNGEPTDKSIEYFKKASIVAPLFKEFKKRYQTFIINLVKDIRKL